MSPAKAMSPNAKCGAKTGKGTCKLAAGQGTDHVGVGRCKHHGGSTPNAQMAGVVELARRDMVTMGRPLDLAPHEAIIECIRIAAGEVAYCSQKVAALEQEDVMIDTMFGSVLNQWIKVRQGAMDRLVVYSATALKAGVEERAVRVAEQHGEAFVGFMQRVLDRMGLGDDPRALEAVRAELLMIDGTARDVTSG